MRWLDHSPVRGGVLTRAYLGQLVPGLTGRRTYFGSPNWTPDYLLRAKRVAVFFSGAMGGIGTLRFAQASGARFVLADCHTQRTEQLEQALDPVAVAVRRFGCATIYQVPTGAPAPAVTAAPGFASMERDDKETWRWAVRPVAALGVSNLSRLSRRVVFSADLSAPAGRRMEIGVRYPDGATSRIALSGGPSGIRRAFTLPRHGGAITFSTDQSASHLPPDPRPLYFQVLDAKLTTSRR